jgi:hypothetical protein
VRAAARRAGIKGNVSSHWLRHAHASHSLDRGASIHLVQQTLGHENMATTGKYTHARAACIRWSIPGALAHKDSAGFRSSLVKAADPQTATHKNEASLANIAPERGGILTRGGHHLLENEMEKHPPMLQKAAGLLHQDSSHHRCMNFTVVGIGSCLAEGKAEGVAR